MSLNSFDDKMATMFSSITVKCPCGHSVIIAHPKTSVICTWCGYRVYKNDKEKFKDELIKTMRRSYDLRRENQKSRNKERN